MTSPSVVSESKVLTLDTLQAQLQKRFPAASVRTGRTMVQQAPPPLPKEGAPSTLSWSLFQRGTLNEVLTTHAGLLIQHLSRPRADFPTVLIDAHNSFHPGSHTSQTCAQLLWIPCQNLNQTLKCTDLFLRDGNLPHLLLDLHRLSLREERQIPRSLWNRFHSQARESGVTLLTLSPRPLLASPAQRLIDQSHFDLNHLEKEKPHLQLENDHFQNSGRRAVAG